ncbi:hypothetical protein R3W88_008948 [Solanum pinnatisectum]|uniref:Uncharacterized protein n=1 Tax=Solanum pinnatisectum TaxID=50273 RepID=A0AAV9MBI7_9SOLN|nr:hypothetical protein R3W88_008948 [Solanum pinnatisectum]
MKKYFGKASQTNKNLEETFTERFKVSPQKEDAQQHMDSPLKSCDLQRGVEKIDQA